MSTLVWYIHFFTSAAKARFLSTLAPPSPAALVRGWFELAQNEHFPPPTDNGAVASFFFSRESSSWLSAWFQKENMTPIAQGAESGVTCGLFGHEIIIWGCCSMIWLCIRVMTCRSFGHEIIVWGCCSMIWLCIRVIIHHWR